MIQRETIETSYHCHRMKRGSTIEVTVPGSKSITNRALFLAAMAKGKSVLKGVLFSDDSRVFMKALEELGYDVECNEVEKCVAISGNMREKLLQDKEIYVGSAGTAARFLTAFLVISGGRYTVTASAQMEKRPMKGLLCALEQLGGKLQYPNEPYHFPIEICGFESKEQNEIKLNIDESSQYLSALLMTAPYYLERTGESVLRIRLTGSRKARSYVGITMHMMEQYGIANVVCAGDTYEVSAGESYQPMEYEVEPDVSAACYFYGMAAITGGNAKVMGVTRDSMQGDISFLRLLESMGCQWRDEEDGVRLIAPGEGRLPGVDVDMSDFSDQSMTLAAMAPFFGGKTILRGIGHIRKQESNRIRAIVTELQKLGIQAEEKEDGVIIHPGEPISGTRIETYEDHRMAMAFSLIGCMVEDIWIENPNCCKKTFENYFEVLDSLDKS